MTTYVKCFRDFGGGLSELGGEAMADRQLQRADNLIPGEGAGLARAEGLTQPWPQLPDVGDGNQQLVTDLIRLTLSEQQTQLLAFSEYGATSLLQPGLSSRWQNIYRYDEQQQAWILLAQQLHAKLDWFIYARKLYWLTGGAYYVYDGSQISQLEATPSGEELSYQEQSIWSRVTEAVAVEQRGQRWFYATANNEVIFSEIGDPARVDPSSLINVNPGGNDRIYALKEFNNGVLILLENSVYLLQGWDLANGTDVSLTRLNVTSGTKFPHSAQIVDNGLLYLGRDGIYRLRVPGNSLSVAAENISAQRISQALFAPGQPELAFATVWRGVYHLSLHYHTAEQREYRYYTDLDAFFGPYDHGACGYAQVDAQLYLGLANGRLARLDADSHSYINVTTGAPRPIRVYGLSKSFDLAAAMARQVKLKKVFCAARQFVEQSSQLSLQVQTDYLQSSYRVDLLGLDESLVYGEGQFGAALWGWQDAVVKQIKLNRRARRVSFCFSDDSLGQPLLIYGVAVSYQPRRLRGESDGVSRGSISYAD